jgi:hypothetical protein
MRSLVPVFLFAACCSLAGCLATPTTFVLSQPQRSQRFDSYVVRFAPIADDTEFDADLKETFEDGVKSALAGHKSLRAVAPGEVGEHTLELHYRAAGVAGGSLAMRAGSHAVNAFLPVGVVPEIGGGDLAVETTFLDHGGTVVGRVLVQSEVHGLFSTDSRTMSRIGSQTGDYVASRFATDANVKDDAKADVAPREKHVVNLCPEKAKAELAPLQPFIGTWDMTYDIEIADNPPVHAKVVEISRWEANGRIFFQFAETQDLPEKLFRCHAITWDPVAEGLQLFAIDSTFGAHESHAITFDPDGKKLRGVCAETHRVTEVVEVFSPDGSSRTGTKEVWSANHDRLLMRIRSEGTKRPVQPAAPGP